MRKDWQGKNIRGENISFDEKNFLRWLLTGTPRKVEDWPQEGEILKWFAEDDTLAIEEAGIFDDEYNAVTNPRTRKIILGLAVIAIAGGLIWHFTRPTQKTTPTPQPSNILSQDNTPIISRDIKSGDKAQIISGDILRSKDIQLSQDTTPQQQTEKTKNELN